MPTQEDKPILELRYRLSESEHRRCLYQLGWYILPAILFRRPKSAVAVFGVAGFAAFFLASFLSPLIKFGIQQGLLSPALLTDPVNRELAQFYLAFSMTAMLALFAVLVLQLWLVEHTIKRGAGIWQEETRFLASPIGIECLTPARPPGLSDWDGVLLWSDVTFLRKKDGDIYAIADYYEASQYIPRYAFASPESADTFYDALVALRRSKGDPDAVPASFRAGFAPPPA